MVATTAASPPARRQLSRAGWNVISGSSLPGAGGGSNDVAKSSSAANLNRGRPETPTSRPATPSALREFQAEGRRLVGEAAKLWHSNYIFMIRNGGTKDGCLHYEVLLSRPACELPVPNAVVSVCFAFRPPIGGRAPKLFYSFEEGDLRHEWTLVQDAKGQWQAATGQQAGSLRERAFETYLHGCVREKDKVRERGIDIKTSFEVSRLVPPPAFVQEWPSSKDYSDFGEDSCLDFDKSQGSGMCRQQSAKEEMAIAMQDALRSANMFSDLVPAPRDLNELLNNIFDAADEEDDGLLPHYEVSKVLMATLPGFGLEEWDIHHLLSFAEETDEGQVIYKGFVAKAPERIQALRTLRQEYKERGLPGVEVPMEAVKHCFQDELTLMHDKLIDIMTSVAQEDPERAIWSEPQVPDGTTSRSVRGELEDNNRAIVALKRTCFPECFQQLYERISPQEARMITQMLPEDDRGFLFVTELAEHLERLRVGAVLNAVVESDTATLRKQLVLSCRPLLDESGNMKIWMMKQGLMNAHQLCLSRLQIHMLLCLTNPDTRGDVDVNTFLALCNSVIPHMMSARIFVETAERLQAEAAEAAKERQNAEWAMGTTRATTSNDDDEEPAKEKVVEMDQENVERTLIQVFSLSDDTRKPIPALPPATIFELLFNANDQQVQSCGLDILESAGLCAEMTLDANGEVPYHDFVRRWVPIMFELRQNQLLSAYVKQGAAEHLGLPEPNLPALEAVHPLMAEGQDQDMPMVRQDSKVVKRRRGSVSKETPNRQLTYQSSIGSQGGGRGFAGRSRQASIQSNRDESDPTPVKKIPSKVAVAEIPPGRGYVRRKMRLEAPCRPSSNHLQVPQA